MKYCYVCYVCYVSTNSIGKAMANGSNKMDLYV